MVIRMSDEKVFFKNSSIQVTQSKLIIDENQYEIDTMNFVNLVDQFGGFTLLGWLFILIGVALLPMYGSGVIVMLLAYVYFSKKKYALKIMINKKQTEILNSKNLKYLQEIKHAIDEAIDISMANRMKSKDT